MPRYMVLSKLAASGHRMARADGLLHRELARAVDDAGGRIIEQYAMFGDYHVCSLVEVRDNDTAQQLELACHADGGDRHVLAPAIDVALFARLMGQSTENTGPYRWQIWWPARVVRRLFRRYAYSGLAARYFEPFTVIGGEHLERLRGPAIFIGNHTSFMDPPAMHEALPRRYKSKVAWPAAADRFYLKGRKDLRKQGWWFSLVYNSFPLRRGGGRAALAHADWLLDHGWSIGIFPEGARTSTSKLARFRMGPAILAVSHGVPVVPMHLDGLAAIRPKGSQEMQPGPVTVRVGPPLRFAPDADVAEATRALHRAVSELGRRAAEERRAQRAARPAHDPAATTGAAAAGETATGEPATGTAGPGDGDSHGGGHPRTLGRRLPLRLRHAVRAGGRWRRRGRPR